MRRTALKGHALRSEGKPYAFSSSLDGSNQADVLVSGTGGYALCECGASSEWRATDAARRRWHREVHKPGVRALLGLPPAGPPVRRCERPDGGQPCGAVAGYRISAGRAHDAEDSCGRHLAATVTALAGSELILAHRYKPVTVTVVED